MPSWVLLAVGGKSPGHPDLPGSSTKRDKAVTAGVIRMPAWAPWRGREMWGLSSPHTPHMREAAGLEGGIPGQLLEPLCALHLFTSPLTPSPISTQSSTSKHHPSGGEGAFQGHEHSAHSREIIPSPTVPHLSSSTVLTCHLPSSPTCHPPGCST